MSTFMTGHITTRPTCASASEHLTQAGPVSVVWPSIYPPLQSLAPGVQASAPLFSSGVAEFNGTPPLSRSSSRFSSALDSPFPTTPLIPVSTVAQPAMINFEGALVNGDILSKELSCLDHAPPSVISASPRMHHPLSAIATDMQPRPLPQLYPTYNAATPFTNLTQYSSCISPNFHAAVEFGNHYGTVGFDRQARQILSTPGATPLPSSCQFTFVAQPQMTYPQGGHAHMQYQAPSSYTFSENFGLPAAPQEVFGPSNHTWTACSNSSSATMAVQHQQFLPSSTDLLIDPIHFHPDLVAYMEAPLENPDGWLNWITRDLSPVQARSVPDDALHASQPNGLPVASPSTASVDPPQTSCKRTWEELMANGDNQKTPKAKKKKKSNNKATGVAAGGAKPKRKVKNPKKKKGYPCSICGNAVTRGRETFHFVTLSHRRALNPGGGEVTGDWECAPCKKYFSRKDALRRHVRLMHLKEKENEDQIQGGNKTN